MKELVFVFFVLFLYQFSIYVKKLIMFIKKNTDFITLSMYNNKEVEKKKTQFVQVLIWLKIEFHKCWSG